MRSQRSAAEVPAAGGLAHARVRRLHRESRRSRSAAAQVYAPVDEAPSAFHRTLFVFVSPQARAAARLALQVGARVDARRLLSMQGDQLQQPGAVRAFRSQLPRANPFYSYEPAGAALGGVAWHAGLALTHAATRAQTTAALRHRRRAAQACAGASSRAPSGAASCGGC